MRVLLGCGLLVLIVVLVYPAGEVCGEYAPQITARIESGEKIFDLDHPEYPAGGDRYDYWRLFLRYRQGLRPYSHYFFSYEYLDRLYREREIYTSRLHRLTASLTYQFDTPWRLYLRFVMAGRKYPHAPGRTYRAGTPSIQLRYFPREGVSCGVTYRIQRRLHPQRQGADHDSHALTLEYRQRVSDVLTVDGRYRVEYERGHEPGGGSELERRLTLSFTYVVE